MGGAINWFAVLSSGAAAFDPVTNTYNSGSANETVPAGASLLTVKVWGGGGAGRNATGFTGDGGGGGGYVKIVSLPIVAADYGELIAYQVGVGGAGSFVDATLDAGTLNLDANPGATGVAGGAGGTATANGWAGGGTVTAETGQAGTTGTGGSAGGAVSTSDGGGAGGEELGTKDGTAPGGGGAGTENGVTSPAGGGGAGRIVFEWS